MAPAPAEQPEDLSRLFVERANAGDVEGLVALYEPGAVLALSAGQVTVGADAIRRASTELLATRPTFALGDIRPALRNGDLALTSTRTFTRTATGATVEVARRLPEDTWRWIIDQPTSLG